MQLGHTKLNDVKSEKWYRDTLTYYCGEHFVKQYRLCAKTPLKPNPHENTNTFPEEWIHFIYCH